MDILHLATPVASYECSSQPDHLQGGTYVAPALKCDIKL